MGSRRTQFAEVRRPAAEQQSHAGGNGGGGGGGGGGGSGGNHGRGANGGGNSSGNGDGRGGKQPRFRMPSLASKRREQSANAAMVASTNAAIAAAAEANAAMYATKPMRADATGGLPSPARLPTPVRSGVDRSLPPGLPPRADGPAMGYRTAVGARTPAQRMRSSPGGSSSVLHSNHI